MEKQLKLINQIRKELDELELLYRIETEIDEVIDNSAQEYKKLELWVDGGSKGNPGLGYGSYAFGDFAEYKIEFGDNITSNEAEYLALIAGLDAVEKVYTVFNLAQISLMIKTDSELVRNQLLGQWAVKKEHLRPLVSMAKDRLENFANWQIQHVSRRDVELVLGH